MGSVIGLIHNDRHAGAIDRQYDDCAKRSVTKHNSGSVSVALKFQHVVLPFFVSDKRYLVAVFPNLKAPCRKRSLIHGFTLSKLITQTQGFTSQASGP
jgi:hypothetical protein